MVPSDRGKLYFPGAVVRPCLDSGELIAIADAPIVHVVYDSSLDPALRDMALASLQRIANDREEIQTEVIEEQTEQVVLGGESDEDMTS